MKPLKAVSFYEEQEVQIVEQSADAIRAVHDNGDDLRMGQLVCNGLVCRTVPEYRIVRDVIGAVREDVPHRRLSPGVALAIGAGAYLGHSPDDVVRKVETWNE